MGRREDRYFDDILKGEPLSLEAAADVDAAAPGFGSITSFGSTIGQNDGVVKRRKRQKRRKRKQKLPPVEQVLARPRDFYKDVQSWPSDFHWAILRHCRSQVTSNPLSGLELLPQVSGLLGELDDRCITTQIKCCYATAHRLSERLDLAEKIFVEALSMTSECWACDADLNKRLSAVLRDQKRFAEALARLDRSIEIYQSHHDPGHDLDKNGLGISLSDRGTVLFEMGQVAEAIEVISRALKVIDPRVSPKWHNTATFNLAVGLAHSKRSDHFALAASHLSSRLSSYGRQRKASQERGKFYWLMGKLVFRLGSTRRGIELVRRGRADLLEIKMPQAFMAATSDLARMDASVNEVLELMLDLTEKTDSGVRFKDWIPEAFCGLAKDIIQACRSDKRAKNLEALLVELRQRTGGDRIMPCLVD